MTTDFVMLPSKATAGKADKAGVTAASLAVSGYARYVGRRIEESSSLPVESVCP